jgi:guanosine-3',5'-bis(diphosphate) 3'-pyrophosphohydrolase
MDESHKLLKAVHFAAEKHRYQKRKDLEATPYINHPIAVAETLRIHGVTDEDVLVAALLHDTIEDTDTTSEEVSEAFGEGVLGIMLEMTDDKSSPKLRRKELQIEHASELSKGARLVKLADKICNVRDMIHSPPVGWPVERLQQYVDWCEAVVANMGETNIELMAFFEQVCHEARAHFK